MIRRWRSTGYNRAAAGTGSDTDALQTDVMRFMSILGLCLMAVFALVQSLPLQEVEAVQEEPERTRLHADIATQQQRAQVLKAELQRLVLMIEQAEATQSEKQRSLSDAETQLRAVVDRTEQARNEQLRVSHELRRLQQQLEHSRYSLAALQQAADDKAQSLRSLQQRLDKEHLRLDDIRRRSRELKRQQVQKQAQRRKQALKQRPAPATPAPVVAEPTAKPTKRGFTLRFASDDALRRQVASGQVSLFAMANKQAWRLSLPHGRPVFTDSAFPGWFHEMAASTVPAEYVRQLRVAVAPTSRGSVVWGVQLPAATKRDIASLTRGRQGGDLVIAANGRVKLADE